MYWFYHIKTIPQNVVGKKTGKKKEKRKEKKYTRLFNDSKISYLHFKVGTNKQTKQSKTKKQKMQKRCVGGIARFTR